MFYLAVILSGVLFGFGMVLSGMVDPYIVIGFLDISGNWIPDLAFVMGGGLLVFVPSYFFLINNRKSPVIAKEFCVPKSKDIDNKLLLGAMLFGLGWGLVGFCPGPVITSLSSGNITVYLFVLCMALGMYAGQYYQNSQKDHNMVVPTVK